MTTTSGPDEGATTVGPETRKPGPIRLKTPTLASIHKAVRHPYHCGVTEDARQEVIHAGGFDFPLMEGARFDAVGDPVDITDGNRGKVHNLTDAEAAVVLERISGKWIRYRGHGQWDQVSTVLGERPVRNENGVVVRNEDGSDKMEMAPNPRFHQRRGDVPLGCFVYLVRLPDKRPMRGMGQPAPLIDRKQFKILPKVTHSASNDITDLVGTAQQGR